MNADRDRKKLLDENLSPDEISGRKPTYKHLGLKVLIPLFIFVWPFIYFFREVIPFNDQYVAISNDFDSLYYVYKVYLLDGLSHLRIPFWSPSEAAGFPFYSSPFAQAFYPLNLFLVVFYNLAGGYTRLDHQTFTVLGVSIFAIGLFCWLRLLNLNFRAVIFATCVMSVSFKVAEIFRFPNAVHTAAWYPWILFAIVKVFLSQSVKESVKYGVLLVCFLICFLTGGYPYYIYYSLFLFGPFLLVFFIPKLRQKLLVNPIGSLKTSIVVLSVAGLSSLLICGFYLYKISQLLKETTDRAGGNFEYSTAHLFNFEDTIGSLIFPPAAQAEGWYYFGISSVLLIFLYFFSSLSAPYSSFRKSSERVRAENLPWYQDPWIKIFFFLWIGAISYITYGRESYLFILLWKYMPSFSSLRVWGRMNIILVPIIAWLLAIAYTHFEELISRKNASQTAKRFYQRTHIYVLLSTYAAIILIQVHLFRNKLYDYYWTEYFKYLSSKESLLIKYGLIAFLITFFLLVLASKIQFQSSRTLAVILSGMILFSALDMRSIGSGLWIYPSPIKTTNRSRVNLAQLNFESFTIPRIDEQATIALSSTFSIGTVENWYFNRYVQFLERTNDELEARRQLMGMIDGRKLYFSQSINHQTLQAFLEDAAQFKDFERVISYTGDELTLVVRTATEGYLNFIDNWDWDWKVAVDSKPTPIELLFGTFKSVRLVPGEHRVIFSYRPGFLPVSR
jgi:hypothetical protein